MRELICSLPARFGMTVLMSSHLLSEIDQMATHVGVIREGELIFQGEMQSLHQLRRSSLAMRTLDNARAAEVLRQCGIPYQASEGYLVLQEAGDDRVAQCVDSLVRQGVGVARLEERKTSLEDIFLDLTGKAVSL